MNRGLAEEEIANEAPNHLAGGQTSPLCFSFQGHGLLTRQQYGQLDHIVVQSAKVLSVDLRNGFCSFVLHRLLNSESP
jgi:hypothetical protein